MTIDGRFTSDHFTTFLKRLIHNAERPIFVITDRHPVHRSARVQKFVEGTDGVLRISFLPSYSPKLNPDELVWNHVKNHRVGRSPFKGPNDLKTRVTSALRSLQNVPTIIQGFFRERHVRYATT